MPQRDERAVISQDEAVIAISKALRRSRVDLKDPRRPIGSFVQGDLLQIGASASSACT
jgi:ATP-dependent Clp protease ATP-binding subunit ClpC